MGKPLYTAEQFVKAIPGTGGIVSTIAKRVGCEWNTAKSYIDKYPTIQKAYEDECERVDDAAESVVIKAIQDGDLGAAYWWLSRKRKDKFSTRNEFTGKNGQPIENINTLEIKAIDYRTIAAALAPGSVSDSDPSGEDQSPFDGQAVG